MQRTTGAPQVHQGQGLVMTISFAREAARCRSEAHRFAGRAEEPFLLRLSEAFDELEHRQQLISLELHSKSVACARQTDG